jgi:uncharacterized protein YcgI (DUF1989 family)
MSNEKLTQFQIPGQSGIAFTVKEGQFIRVIDVEGGQVSDLVCFAQHDPDEHLSSGRMVDYNNKLLFSTGDVVYSNRSRPMLTIVSDQVGSHTCLYAPCSQEMFEKTYGVTEPHLNCLDNLNENLAPFGLDAHGISAPFNIFMNVEISAGGVLRVLPAKSKAGDTIELRAEMDLIVAVTACSAGLCNNFNCTGIDIEIYAPD